jgi:hypothetical protein
LFLFQFGSEINKKFHFGNSPVWQEGDCAWLAILYCMLWDVNWVCLLSYS